MWVQKLKELRIAAGNPSSKWISGETGLSERTINRICAGETDCPKADNLYKIVKVLGGSLDDILAETDVVVGNEDKITLQENVDAVTDKNDKLMDTVIQLEREIFRLKEVIAHKDVVISLKDEIIETHKSYHKPTDAVPL